VAPESSTEQVRPRAGAHLARTLGQRAPAAPASSKARTACSTAGVETS